MDVRQPIPSQGGDLWSRFGELWRTQIAQLKTVFGKSLEEVWVAPAYPTDMPILFIEKEKVIDLLLFLKNSPGFEYQFLADITATDEESAPRFHVVYQLFSLEHKNRIRVKVRVAEGESILSAVSVWKGADWAEREVYDMFGIHFQGHPDLRRILMDVRWVGHPLRKDYPLKGYQIFTEPEPIDSDLLK
jgi:NADH-quinone oxidoreductase subunit C